MKIALTGHANIEKCYSYDILNGGTEYNKDCFDLAYDEIYSSLLILCELNGVEFNSLTLISGMARGADEVFAEVAYRNDLKLILSIPHTIEWHKNRVGRKLNNKESIRAQAVNYDKYLNYDKSSFFEIKKTYGSGEHMYANFARNQHMVDSCDLLISFKKYNSSGTDHCIKEGLKQGKYFGNVGEIDLTNEFEI